MRAGERFRWDQLVVLVLVLGGWALGMWIAAPYGPAICMAISAILVVLRTWRGGKS